MDICIACICVCASMCECMRVCVHVCCVCVCACACVHVCCVCACVCVLCVPVCVYLCVCVCSCMCVCTCVCVCVITRAVLPFHDYYTSTCSTGPGREADGRLHILILSGPSLGNNGRERLCKSAIAQHPYQFSWYGKVVGKGSDIEKE